METKFCCKCERDLPLSMFHKDKSTKDGLDAFKRLLMTPLDNN
jgi:hypothetical protein